MSNRYVNNKVRLLAEGKIRRNRDMIAASYKRRGFKKNSRTHNIIGCTFEQLFEHLKQTAIKNYGGWHARINYHVDHVIPLCTAKTEEDILKLCHFSNLQYLTPLDNLTKSGKLDWRLHD